MTALGIRANNPFDISLPSAGYFGGTVIGAPGQSGFAQFPDMQTGYNAGVQRLADYVSGNTSYGPQTTLSQLGGIYATDPNWASSVSRLSGIPLNQTLDANNSAQMQQLGNGILQQELGVSAATPIINQYGGGATSNGPLDDAFDSGSGLSGYNTNSIFDSLPDNTFNDTGAASGQGGIGSDTVAGGDLSPIDYGSTPTSGQYSSWLNQQTAPAVSGTGGIGSDAAASAQQSGNPLEPSAASGSGQSASTAPTATNPNAQAPPVDIVSNAPEIAAANALSKALSGQTAGASTDTSSIEGAVTGWINNIFSAELNALVRGGFFGFGSNGDHCRTSVFLS